MALMTREALLATRTSVQSRLLANEGRVLILRLLDRERVAPWSRLKGHLERELGVANPNTLLFHIKTLERAGWIRRTGSLRDAVYELAAVPPEALQMIGSGQRTFVRAAGSRRRKC